MKELYESWQFIGLIVVVMLLIVYICYLNYKMYKLDNDDEPESNTTFSKYKQAQVNKYLKFKKKTLSDEINKIEGYIDALMSVSHLSNMTNKIQEADENFKKVQREYSMVKKLLK